MVTYLNQLKQIGAFDKINGILLGTFTKMEELQSSPSIVDLVKQYAGSDMPVAEPRKSDMAFLRKELLLVKRFVCAHAVLR